MLRFFAALVAALVAFVPAVIVVAVLGSVLAPRTADALAPLVFVAVPIAAFVVVYRWIPRSRRELSAEVEERRRLAISRGIPEKAQTIAEGGEGVWQTDTWRVTGGTTPSIAILENGAWTTVFQAKFHARKYGQWVPTKVTRDYPYLPRSTAQAYRDPHTVHSAEMGGTPSRWDILVYRSGPWEDELDAHVRAAEDATLARERARMGLT